VALGGDGKSGNGLLEGEGGSLKRKKRAVNIYLGNSTRSLEEMAQRSREGFQILRGIQGGR